MQQLRVFVVDDDEDFAESLAMVLEGHDCEVELAYNGEDAIARFRAQDFDITFMDVKLPGKNGVESFLEIHTFKPEAKVVMMTGYSVEQLLEQAIDHGAWSVLRKPLDMRQLLDIVDKLGSDGILIADDDQDFVASFKDLLEDADYRVFVAKNGREAIDRIMSNGIDILILDLRMPMLNGLETYLELKRCGHAIPTIIVTAYAAENLEDVLQLQSLAVSGILRKPFDPRELLEAVERLAQTDKE